ncbi:MAG: hypothetical protein IJB85_12775 [Clostridia bacterium]|nr:hypothetical protein [Clostridia bacterium]
MEHYRKKNAGYTYRDSYAIDNDTGEVLKTQNMQIIEGSHVFSPMEWDRRKRLAEERTERECRIASSRPLGNFLMVSGRGFDELPPASLTRLIMLATYADYNNTLMAGRDKPMTRSEAQKILGLSNTAFKQFIKAVVPRFLIERSGVLHLTDRSTFLRGKLPKDDHAQRWKMYIRAVRRLYSVTDKRQHKYLGYVFELLRFINVEFNVLCYDIYETDLEMIKPMSLYEFCEAIGFDWSHLNRLLSAYRQLFFTVDGHQERFVSIVSDGIDKRNARVFVNPHVIYSGSDYKRVEILGAFCKI